MSCAGCDDCPQDDSWHLHVTVDRVHEQSGEKVTYSAAGYRLDIERLGYRAVSVWNVVPGDPPDIPYDDPRIRSYREWIPTLHYLGTESRAVYELFVMGHRLKNLGWIPRRLKIEGDARRVPPGRALYYEAHAKITAASSSMARQLGLPISLSKNLAIVTVRRESVGEVMSTITDVSVVLGFDPRDVRVEACVLDTGPELDEAWLRGTLAQ